MRPDCALAEFVRSGGPRQVPLRECCVVALLSGSGVCSRVAAEQLEAEPLPDRVSVVGS